MTGYLEPAYMTIDVLDEEHNRAGGFVYFGGLPVVDAAFLWLR